MGEAVSELAYDHAPAGLHHAVATIEEAAKHAAEVEHLAHILIESRKARADLATIEREVENELGQRMGEYRVTITGLGVLERHARKSFTQWDREALLRDVLDSKFVNTETGELVDESPLEKVLAVWNLGAPRRTVLKERGLQPDEYAQVEEQGGYTIKVVS